MNDFNTVKVMYTAMCEVVKRYEHLATMGLKLSGDQPVYESVIQAMRKAEREYGLMNLIAR